MQKPRKKKSPKRKLEGVPSTSSAIPPPVSGRFFVVLTVPTIACPPW